VLVTELPPLEPPEASGAMLCTGATCTVFDVLDACWLALWDWLSELVWFAESPPCPGEVSQGWPWSYPHLGACSAMTKPSPARTERRCSPESSPG
jgi:hypothetical protein